MCIRDRNKERVQAFQGICIGKKNNGLNSSFTVRKISSGEGVERVFPLYSNVIDSIERVKVGDVRRAKLYYLRGLSGKKARIAERTDGRSYDDDQFISTIKDVEVAPEEKPAEETPAEGAEGEAPPEGAEAAAKEGDPAKKDDKAKEGSADKKSTDKKPDEKKPAEKK